MKALLLFLTILMGCSEPCDLLPRQDYSLVLTNKDPESFFCWTQTVDFNLTSDMTLAADFADDCHVTVARGCGVTELDVLCEPIEVNLTCQFTGTTGDCINDLTALQCHYGARLDPLY
jgi:hypothetical protein